MHGVNESKININKVLLSMVKKMKVLFSTLTDGSHG